MLLYNKECVICGRFYKPIRHSQITCGDKECQHQYNNRYKMLKRGNNRENNRKPLMLGLTKDAIAANMLGMTYGKYKSIQWCRNKQTMKNTVEEKENSSE